MPEPTRNPELLATDAARSRPRAFTTRASGWRRRRPRPARAGVTVQPHVLAGEPELRIVEHARLHGARAIVVGATARPLLERWVLGSVAERTIRTATCPVIVVPRRERGPALVRRDGDGSPDGAQALVGLEGADGGPELVRFAADLRRHGRCDVTFFTSTGPPRSTTRLGLRGSRNPLEVDPDVVKNVEPRLRALVDGLPGQGERRLDIQPAFGAPSSNIALAAGDHPYDLLVVGSHQRHGLTRVLEGLGGGEPRAPGDAHPRRVRPGATDRARRRAVAQGLPRILTVLAPTDLSDVGNAAIPHAYALLRATGGVVELCFVAEHGLPNPPYVYDLPRSPHHRGARRRSGSSSRA